MGAILFTTGERDAKKTTIPQHTTFLFSPAFLLRRGADAASYAGFRLNLHLHRFFVRCYQLIPHRDKQFEANVSLGNTSHNRVYICTFTR